MSGWGPDRRLAGFETKSFAFPDDYDGPVTATLVRLAAPHAPRGAVLYVHGFIDYFFQRHLAERFAQEGYAFHAVDLRKHGRSLLPHQHPCFCRSLSEYYADISRALVCRDDTTRLCAFTRDAAFQPLDRVDQRWRQDGVSESAQFVVCR